MKEEGLGGTLLRLREARGLSLGELARRTGVSKAALQHWERDRARPTGFRLANVLDALEADARLRARLIAAADVQFARVELAHSPLGPPVDVGAVLRVMRARRGMTQADLARASGVTQGAVAKWESGASTPAASTIHAIGFALGAAVEETLALASVQGGGEPAFGWSDPEVALARIQEDHRRTPEALHPSMRLGHESEAWQRASQSPSWDSVLCDVMGRRALIEYSFGNLGAAEATAWRVVRHASDETAKIRAMSAFDVVSLTAQRRRGDPAVVAGLAAAWADAIADPIYKAWALATQARRLAALGQARRALETLDRAVALSRLAAGVDGPTRRWEDVAPFAELHLATGEPEKAMAALDWEPRWGGQCHLYIRVYHANGLAAPEEWIRRFRECCRPHGSGWAERERIAAVDRRQSRLLRRSIVA